ncbi:uncharacterized protein LOC127169514 [Labeo rohita]|uniref:uncharacterized protein LOC127169514 n=1 Tax=Labeo rohita TaxID=84645 RepID=UPI0021E2CC83|nr:uncharacterized protein LOC127169514 [Labeo rohita]
MNWLYILLLALWSTFNSDTTSFLIYNEDHNKCMHAVNATVVQAAPCDASSKAQHFKWLSSSQIISLSFNLCLGSEKIKNWVKIILLPCNDSSPVQTWECKRKCLFGLKGQPLHLNYGHNGSDIMLYTGTGVWSHWQIYVTKENLCSRGYQDVPVPNITVFRQMEDKEYMIVMCLFGRRHIESSFHLFLEGEHNYTLNNPLCYSNEKCVFEMKVSPPVSFTCEHKIHSVESHQSETYTYSPSVQPTDSSTPYCQTQNFAEGHDEEGVPLFYICFFSFITVGLFIMTAAVIVTTIRSKTKGSMITVTDHDYTEA